MIIGRRTLLALPGALWLSGCAVKPGFDASHLPDDPVFADIEKESGGRLGVTLLGHDRRAIASHRAGERFALCSTFKAPLAVALFEAHDAGKLDRFAPVTMTRDDLVSYAPYSEKLVERGEATTLDMLARKAIEISDNAAANMILRALGGPEAMTAFFRKHGDEITRLDRYETSLNENAVGDPRDTTSPLAMAGLLHGLLVAEGRNTAHADLLREWMEGVQTGKNRILAGIPSDWRTGRKTGTSGPSAPAYNDVGILMPPDRPPYILTVYLDRPKSGAAETEAAIASVARHAAEIILATDKRL